MSMEIDGLRINEVTRSSGAAWCWKSGVDEALEYEIEWVQGKDVFLYGTRVRPGGWNVSQLDPSVWSNDGTLEGAREVVQERIPSMPR